MRMISIDPSTKRMALAVWQDGILEQVLFLRADLKGTASTIEQLYGVDLDYEEIAIESQHIYRGGEAKKKSVIKLAQYAGIAVGILYKPGIRITWYSPKEWKGNAPKDVFLPRIKKRLTDEEFATLPLTGFKGPDHDIWDCVGIGLHHSGRL